MTVKNEQESLKKNLVDPAHEDHGGTPHDDASEAPDDFIYLARAMSISRLDCHPEVVKMTKEPVHCATIMGSCFEVKPTVDPKTQETFFALAGEFVAFNHQTKAKYRAGKLFLPGGFHDMALAQMETREDNHTPVEFGLAIWAVPSSAPGGYSYQARSILPARKHDPLGQRLSLLVAQSHKLMLTPPQTGNGEQRSLPSAG